MKERTKDHVSDVTKSSILVKLDNARYPQKKETMTRSTGYNAGNFVHGRS
jgi:hypothetical protein